MACNGSCGGDCSDCGGCADLGCGGGGCGQTFPQSCCASPCNTCPDNTPDCESLPSTLENFISQFFGRVTKTSVDGKVTWSLPCNLDVGLPENPRVDGEGLACFFMRLFENGIKGLKGDPGVPGDPGKNGSNAWTCLTSTFTQPTLSQPNITVTYIPTPIISEGEVVFIIGSGWYQVTGTFGSNVLFLTLLEAIPSPNAVTVPGTLILPTGPRGLSIKGDKGDQGLKGDTGLQGNPGVTGPTGPTGPTGANGTVATNTNGVNPASGTDYDVTSGVAGSYSTVVFGTDQIDVTLPTSGTYEITINVSLTMAAGANKVWTFKMFNSTTALDVPNSEVEVLFFDQAVNHRWQIVLRAHVLTASDNNIIQLRLKPESIAGTQVIYSDQTRLFWVKLA